MTAWAITETPDTPEVHPTIVYADTALAALDVWVEAEGFVPYSELPDDDGTEWVGVDEQGRTWGIFTNTTMYAIPLTQPGGDTRHDGEARRQQAEGVPCGL